MKSIAKLFYFIAITLLALSLTLQNAQPVQAQAASQTITILTHAPESSVYGQSFSVAASTDSALDVIYSAQGNCVNVGAVFTMTKGTGTCIVQYDQPGDVNYGPAQQITETVAAQQAAITISADSQTKAYGEADPALTYTITNGTLIGTDTLTGVLSREPGEDAGEYAIQQGTLALDENYTLTYISAVLTITPAATATATALPTSEPPTVTPALSPTPLLSTPTKTPDKKRQSAGPGRFVSAQGNNQGGNTCANAASPCLTIQQAIINAAAGETIYVTGDAFQGSGTSPIITITKNITISGGWDHSFDTQNNLTTLDGQDSRLTVLVNNNVTATLEKFIITHSQASGIKNLGALTVKNSMIHHNDKPDGGGTSASDGGGIYNTGTLVVVNTAIYDNLANAHSGGGIFNTGSLTITNSTIANNYALHGGGIMYTPTGYAGTSPFVLLNNVTMKDNSANYGGSIYRAADIAPVFLQDPVLRNTIFANNNSCYGSFTSANNNLIYQSSGCTISGSYTNTNPLLGSFSSANGYFPLLHGSPAIDAGSTSTPGSGGEACEATDQFGTTRSIDGNGDTVAGCDVGAYEANSFVANLSPIADSLDIDAGSPQAGEISTAFPTQLSVLVRDQFDVPISGVTVTFTAPASGASGTFDDSGTNTTTANTDSNGIATAAAFTANAGLGSYPVSASVTEISNPVQFRLNNTDVIGSIELKDGSLQSAALSTAFRKVLSVVVKNQSGAPLSGVMVTFTAPASGPSGVFNGTGTNTTAVTTDEGGIATTSVLTANAIEGSYTVDASVSSMPTPFQFQLANVTDLALYVSPTGNDLNTCTFKTAPCLTINGAIEKALSGDTIKVASGTYTNSLGGIVVSLNKSVTLLGGWDANFIAQNGMSTVDGQDVSVGFYVRRESSYGADPVQTVIDHFIVTRGHGPGIIVNYTSSLTVSNSIIRNNKTTFSGGGIDASYGGTLTINNTLIEGNQAWYDGGGINTYNMTVILNNSIVTGNKSDDGSGIYSLGNTTLNNSTVSFNIGGEAISGSVTLNNSTVSENSGAGIGIGGDEVILNNSTVSDNRFGIAICPGTTCSGRVTLQNSIVANNREGDCLGSTITSAGYNLIVDLSGCNFQSATGDIIGKAAKLGKLLPLYGYVPLSPGSPAINAGNPATCLAADQRGVTRLTDGHCDIGAYEYKVPGAVASIGRFAGSGQTSETRGIYPIALAIYAVDNLGSPVQGLTITFSAPAAGPSGIFAKTNTFKATAVTNSMGIANAPSLIANNNPGSYNITATTAGLPNMVTFTLTNLPIPSALAPLNDIYIIRPTYRWSKVTGATQYQYQLMQGNKLVYEKIVGAGSCDSTTCSNTPSTVLKASPYKWKVRALVGGVWKNFSVFKSFTVIEVRPGYWSGPGVEFYVSRPTISRTAVLNFSIYVGVRGCGNYKITHTESSAITNRQFSFSGTFYANGTFDGPVQVRGALGLSRYYIPGCGYLVGGPFSWGAKWRDSTQPTAFIQAEVIPLTADSEPEDTSEYYTVERIGP